MRMKLSFYQEIMEKYNEINKRECLEELCAAFPEVPLETLTSIVAQEVQRKSKQNYKHHVENVSTYYKKYQDELENYKEQNGALLKVADEIGFSPALMAKLILEHHLKLNLGKEKLDDRDVLKTMVSEMMMDPSLIQDMYLGAEIKLCTLVDNHYGHLSDIIRNVGGLEKETQLKDDLTKLGISFVDEKQLREKGYDKTPDVKLDIPIVYQGHIINWIESKSSFGDEERHREYLSEQLWGYINRFGPGLVIYWNGYIEELNNSSEQGIFISDSVPTEISTMDPSVLMNESDSDEDLDS